MCVQETHLSSYCAAIVDSNLFKLILSMIVTVAFCGVPTNTERRLFAMRKKLAEILAEKVLNERRSLKAFNIMKLLHSAESMDSLRSPFYHSGYSFASTVL